MTYIMRLTRAATALSVVAAVVGGGAWALTRFGRLDALTSLDWATIWTFQDNSGIVLGLITLIGWVAWCLATLSLVSELLAVLTQRRWRLRVPGLGVFAPASTVLVTAIVGLAAGQVVTPATAQAAPEFPPAVETTVESNNDEPLVGLETAKEGSQMRTHIVRPGDDLWSLAERYFQDGSRWREIAAANQTVLIRSTDVLQPGMVLAIPDAEVLPAQAGIVVQTGDTLSGLAAQHLGDAQRWSQLVRANSELVEDPDLIDVGWVLALPGDVVPGDAVPGDVVPGDAMADEAQAAVATAASPNATDEPVLLVAPSDGPTLAAEPPAVASLADTLVTASLPAGGLATCPVPTEQPAERPTEGLTASESAAWQAALPSSFGAVLATGLAGAYLIRRRQQFARRPVGHRLPPLSETAVGASAALAAACEEAAAREEAGVTANLDVASPTSVPIGEADQQPIRCDLEGNEVTWLQGDDGDDIAMATAIALTLACAPGDQAVTVVTAGAAFGWLTSLDEPRLVVLEDPAEARRLLDDTLAARAADLPAGRTLERLRSDVSLAEAWGPLVVVLSAPPAWQLPPALGSLGVSVLICGGDRPATVPAASIRISGGQAEYLPTGEVFAPHLVSVPARRVLDEVFAVANQTDYPPAPWWDDTPDTELPTVLRVAAWPGSVEELPVVSTVESEHPIVRLLGPVELAGARGEVPARAIKQCQEYCAWLLENPGASAITMARALLVAEPTRRSNMSRLRSWLGADAEGAAYLPDAYTGRIMLHPAVTSDWEQLQMCISGGVNRVSDASLIQALGMVRGAPLADAAPGQWYWAEQLRADITATITDIAVVLGRRAVDAGNLQAAQWAVDRALVAAPDDELLLGIQIRIAHAIGDRAKVDRLVLQMTRRARLLGVDLADETVTLLQEVVEGRARLRRA